MLYNALKFIIKASVCYSHQFPSTAKRKESVRNCVKVKYTLEFTHTSVQETENNLINFQNKQYSTTEARKKVLR